MGMQFPDITAGTEYYDAMRLASLDTVTSAKEDLLMHMKELSLYKDGDILIYGNEGLWQVTKSILTSIGNVLGRIKNFLTSDKFGYFNVVRNSELEYFTKRSPTTVERILKAPYADLVDVDCPYPVGMKVTYLDAIGKNLTALENIDILTRATVAAKVSEEIKETVVAGNVIDKILSNALALVKLDSVKAVVKKEQDCFDQNAKTTKPKTFGELFPTPKDFKASHDLLLKGVKFINITHPTHKKMVECSDTFEEIVKYLERNAGGTLNKNELEKLAKIAYTLADTFDMFSVLLFDYHRLEHNLVEVYRQINREVFHVAVVTI